MLVALYNNQFVDMLGKTTKEQWKEKMRSGNLMCPVCKHKVTPKCGPKKIWHFAHSLNSTCQTFHEAETNYHLLGKKSIFHWLQNNGGKPILEHYIHEISQRPDLYLPHKNHAIEYQCASMSQELFLSRIRGYQSIHMESEWIFGMNRIKKKINQHFSVQSSDLTAIKRDQHGQLSLNYFCPLQQQFLLLKNIVLLTSTKILATGNTFSIKNMKCTDDFNTILSIKHLITQWINQKVIWRKSVFKNSTPACMYVKKVLYLSHRSLTLYSPLAGMPTSHYYLFETSPLIWQSYLLFLIERLPNSFTIHQLEKELARLISKNIILVRNFPYLNEKYLCAIKGYLVYLEKEKVIIKVTDELYKKIAKIPYPTTMDDAFQQDEIFSKRGGFFDFV